jgi:FMN phosphatase YigB (HAD superfamily)
VTSVDAGCRKPDPRIFAMAVTLAGVPARDCVMIGDSEEADIGPAMAFEMRTIRVVDAVVDSAADAVVTSLAQALETIRVWTVPRG